MSAYFPLRRATSRAHALALARGLCRCKRQSFVGVKWWEGREERWLTWEDVDGERGGPALPG